MYYHSHFIVILFLIIALNSNSYSDPLPEISFTSEESALKKRLIKNDPNDYLVIPLLHKNLDHLISVDQNLYDGFDFLLAKKYRTSLSEQLGIIDRLWNELLHAHKSFNTFLVSNCVRRETVFPNSRQLNNILLQNFSKSYIKSHFSEIINIINYYYVKSIYLCEYEARSELIYNESLFKANLDRFYNIFLIYIKYLELNENKSYAKDLTSIIKTYLNIVEKQAILISYPKLMLIYSMEMSLAQYPRDLVDFFSSLEELKHPFDLSAVSELLDKLEDD